MAKRSSVAIQRPMLEAWEPPPDAGDPIGCLATTFTFDGAFFEEECLSRFLSLETDPAENGAAYLIEREERLAQAYATVLVDRRHAGSDRSLRCDVLPIYIQNAAMHAKVSILHWKNIVRLIVGSANLTTSGYRTNLEVFGILDFHNGGKVRAEELKGTTGFLRDLLKLTYDYKARERAEKFLDWVDRSVGKWQMKEPRGNEPKARVLFGGRLGPRSYEVLHGLRRDIWTDGAPPPTGARVVSPFFDDNPGAAVSGLKGILARSGAKMDFCVSTIDAGSDRVCLQVPESLMTAADNIRFSAVAREEGKDLRSLHAKCIWLERDSRALYMIGSSNFTRAGLGIGKKAWNVEANIAYLASDEDSIKRLKASFPATKSVKVDDDTQYRPAIDHDLDPISGTAMLPTGFESATYVLETIDGEVRSLIKMIFGNRLPKEWHILAPADESLVYHSSVWAEAGQPRQAELSWTGKLAPSTLRVGWTDDKGKKHLADWIVNVEEPGNLPLPEELRQLTLETLLAAIRKRRPLHTLLTESPARRPPTTPNAVEAIDPHKNVDTSGFLLHRTRRLAQALECMREALAKPCPNRRSLQYRLRGPVSPQALVEAIRREGRSTGECAFMLAEVAMMLHRVNPQAEAEGVTVRSVKNEIWALISEIEDTAGPYLREAPRSMKRYLNDAFREAKQR